MKNKNSKTVTDAFSNILSTSKRLPLKLKSVRGSEWYICVLHNFLKLKNIHHFSGFTNKSPSRAEGLIRTIGNLFKKPVFEKGKAYWLSKIPSVIKKYNNTKQNSTKMIPIQVSTKSKKIVYSNLRDDRVRQKPKFKLGQLVRTADIKRFFSKGDATIEVIYSIQ